jgi:hypothetical protein
MMSRPVAHNKVLQDGRRAVVLGGKDNLAAAGGSGKFGSADISGAVTKNFIAEM